MIGPDDESKFLTRQTDLEIDPAHDMLKMIERIAELEAAVATANAKIADMNGAADAYVAAHVASEREACALAAETMLRDLPDPERDARWLVQDIAATIRARGSK